MKVTKIASFLPGKNAFGIDFENMGLTLGRAPDSESMLPSGPGSRIIAMYENHSFERMNWVIIVNEFTGERIRIDFTDDVTNGSERGVI